MSTTDLRSMVTGNIDGDFEALTNTLRGDGTTADDHLEAALTAYERLLRKNPSQAARLEELLDKEVNERVEYDEFMIKSHIGTAGDPTPLKIVASANSVDFLKWREQKRAGQKTELAIAAEEVAKNADANTLGQSLGPGGAASSAMVDKILSESPEVAEKVGESRDLFNAYTSLREVYVSSLAQRSSAAQQLAEENGIPFPEADEIVRQVLLDEYRAIEEIKKKLPDTTFDKVVHSGGTELFPERITKKHDPFALPPKPVAIPTEGRGRSAISRGIGLSQTLGSEEAIAEIEAYNPSEGGRLRDLSFTAMAEAAGNIIGSLPQDVAATIVTGGLINPLWRRAGTRLARAGVGALAGATEGAISGAARGDVEVGDVGARLKGAATEGALTAGLGGALGGAIPSGTPKFKDVPKEKPILGLKAPHTAKAKDVLGEALAKQPKKAPKVEAPAAPKPRPDTLPSEIKAAAQRDYLKSPLDVQVAIDQSAAGVIPGKQTDVDILMNTPQGTKQIYESFSKTREVLREQFGETVPLVRFQGDKGIIKNKHTLNYVLSSEFESKFGKMFSGSGRKLVRRDVPVDDIVAVNVGRRGRYEEFIVLNKPTLKQLNESAVTAKPIEPPPPAKPPVKKVRAGGMDDNLRLHLRSQIKKLASKKRRTKQALMDRAERSKRIRAYLDDLYDPGSKDGGEAYLVASRNLKGELPVAPYEALDLSPDQVSAIFNEGRFGGKLRGFEHPQYFKAVSKLVDPRGARPPARKELELLAKVLGEDIVSDLSDRMGLGPSMKAQIIGTGRSILTSGDISAIGRQNYILGSGHPISAIKAASRMGRHMWTEGSVTRYAEYLRSRPYFDEFIKHGGADTASPGKFRSTDEELFFRDNFLSRRKFTGYWTRASERAFGVATTDLRYRAFESAMKATERETANVIGKLEKVVGRKLDLSKPDDAGMIADMIDDALEGRGMRVSITKKDRRILNPFRRVNGLSVGDWQFLQDILPIGKHGRSKAGEDLARMVNWGTGRGKTWKALSGEAGSVAFAPRFVASRLQAFNPMHYAKMSRVARRRALRSVMGAAVVGWTQLYMHYLRGRKVGINPTSPDFGRVLEGDPRDGVRLDVWGGHSWIPRLFSQVVLAMYQSSKSGKSSRLDAKNAWRNTWDVVRETAVEQKLVPILTSFINKLKGTDFRGEEAKWSTEAFRQVVPIIASDIYDLWVEDPEVFAEFTAAAILGQTVISYKDRDLPEFLAETTGAQKIDEELSAELQKQLDEVRGRVKRLRYLEKE